MLFVIMLITAVICPIVSFFVYSKVQKPTTEERIGKEIQVLSISFMVTFATGAIGHFLEGKAISTIFTFAFVFVFVLTLVCAIIFVIDIIVWNVKKPIHKKHGAVEVVPSLNSGGSTVNGETPSEFYFSEMDD